MHEAGLPCPASFFMPRCTWRVKLKEVLAAYLQKTAGHGALHDFRDRLLSYRKGPIAIIGPELFADLDKRASAVRAAANYGTPRWPAGAQFVAGRCASRIARKGLSRYHAGQSSPSAS
jgi:hypothetical protein